MSRTGFALTNPPIVEAIIDIDCDVPVVAHVDTLDRAAKAALADRYPTARRRMFSAHQITAQPGEEVAVTSSEGLQALQYFSCDEKQIVQFRLNGFSFNRLAPYASLDDYLPEIERTWKLFVALAHPALCRTIRLRYINRISIPLTGGRVDLEEYLKGVPQLPEETEVISVGLFSQHSVVEPATGNLVNIVLANEAPERDCLPMIFDIEAFSTEDIDPTDWATNASRIASLRSLKNRIFKSFLTDQCLSLFRR